METVDVTTYSSAAGSVAQDAAVGTGPAGGPDTESPDSRLRHELRLREELHGMYTKVGFYDPEKWKVAPAQLDERALRILGHPVMEDWEHPYMERLAAIATSRGGSAPDGGARVLEIGFGMGISANYVISNPRVSEHVIIEANHDIAELARKFRDSHPTRTIRIFEGLSYDVIADEIEEFREGSFDGILHDAYPLDESQVQNQAHFARTAYRLLRPGGVFTYFSDEPTQFRPEHLRMLTDAGFDRANIGSEIVEVSPPPECEYWKSDTIVAPIVVK